MEGNKEKSNTYIARRAKIFIGGAKKHLNIALAIQANLCNDFDVDLWDEGAVFKLNKSHLDNLVNALDDYDFAILALTPDDMLSGKGNTKIPRDNVVFELGLFMGRLGLERTYFISPDIEGLKLPSDLDGISYGKYNYQNENLKASLRPVCETIRELLKKIGIKKNQFPGIQEYCEVDIYYNKLGINSDKAFDIAKKLRDLGIKAWAKKHDINKKPDAIFIGCLVSVYNVRLVFELLKDAYPIRYIFRPDYPSSEGGDENGYKIGIGYLSSYNQGLRSKLSEPVEISERELKELLNPELTNADFQCLLHKLTKTYN